nr:Eco57I restriction-modification methylase domain-containing protein [Halobacillus mangrovi]
MGNPPYKSQRQSLYLRENKTFLKEEFQSIGVHNMYSLFIYKGIQLLKEGGILSMIVQDSFLSNVYYKRFRKYLLKNTEIKEIILAPRRLFHKGKADVRTAILTIVKKDPSDSEHSMKLIDRLMDQNYSEPENERVQYLPQKTFESIPDHNFAINIPMEILSLFKTPYTALGDIVKIGTGISTGNDRYFLRTANEVANKEGWIPFYKNGGAKDAWYYSPKYYIHEDWPLQKQLHPNFTTRNPLYFYHEGITCSSMGVEFSAAYLPKGSLFG